MRRDYSNRMAQTFYSPDLAQSVALIQPLPDGRSLAQIRELGDDYMAAALLICTPFETMDLVLDLAGASSR